MADRPKPLSIFTPASAGFDAKRGGDASDRRCVMATLVAAVTTGFTGLLALALFVDADAGVRNVAVAGVTYCCASLFFHPRQSIRRDPFAPAVVLKGLTILALFANLSPLTQTGSSYNPGSLVVTAWIGILFLVCGDLGVFLLPAGRTPTSACGATARQAGRPWLVGMFASAYALGWMWRVYALKKGLLYGTLLATSLEVTAYSNLLGMFNQFSTLAFFGLLVFSRRLKWLMVLLPLEILWKWIGSSKAGAVYIVLPVLMVLFQRGKIRLGWRTVASAAGLTVLFLGSFVVIHQYRVAAQRTILSQGYSAFSPVAALSEVKPDRKAVDEVLAGLSARFDWAKGPTAVREYIADTGREEWHGASYLRCFSWLVPRFLWPNKPDVSLGRWYANEVLGWSTKSRSEAEITIWGEGFLNFGLLGAWIAPVLWLLLMQGLYLLGVSQGEWGLLFLGSVYVVILNSLAVNVAVSVAAIGQTLILLALAAALARMLDLLRPLVGMSGVRA